MASMFSCNHQLFMFMRCLSDLYVFMLSSVVYVYEMSQWPLCFHVIISLFMFMRCLSGLYVFMLSSVCLCL